METSFVCMNWSSKLCYELNMTVSVTAAVRLHLPVWITVSVCSEHALVEFISFYYGEIEILLTLLVCYRYFVNIPGVYHNIT